MASVTLAPAAVLFTGKPPSRRGARKAIRRSGPPTDSPALATSSAAEPPPTAASSARRLSTGASGAMAASGESRGSGPRSERSATGSFTTRCTPSAATNTTAA